MAYGSQKLQRAGLPIAHTRDTQHGAQAPQAVDRSADLKMHRDKVLRGDGRGRVAKCDLFQNSREDDQ